MSEDFFEINDMKDLGRVIFFFIVSPVIGIVMFIGMVSTSIAMVCMYIKEFIMKRFYE